MNRFCSEILICLFILLSPLTFSNEKIKNFTPDFGVSFGAQERILQAALNDGREEPANLVVAETEPALFLFLPPGLLHLDEFNPPPQSRAPPA